MSTSTLQNVVISDLNNQESESEIALKSDIPTLTQKTLNKNKNTKNTNLEENHENDSSSTINTNTKQIEWSVENEMIMVEWCDIAQCYKWMNSRAYIKYSTQHAWFTIPAITLSTISGTASFAQSSLPIEYQRFSPMVIGAINIFIGILTTIQQYLKISELNESHRVAAIAWDKYSRNIRIELAKAPNERMDAGHFLKLSRQEFDRLMETSPSIPLDIISSFKSTFAKNDGYTEIRKPDICDIIVSSNTNRHHWYLNNNHNINKSTDIDDIRINTNIQMDQMTQMNQNMIADKMKELREKEALMIKREKEHEVEEKSRVIKRKELQSNFAKIAQELTQKIKTQNKEIDDYISQFYQAVGRNPLNDEILAHFNDGKIDADIMDKYLKKYALTVAIDIV
jgi:hypothetical protein